MAQFKGNADPDIDEVIPYTPGQPIVVGGRVYNPTVCKHGDDPNNPDSVGVDHKCVHDWRIYWGVQPRVL